MRQVRPGPGSGRRARVELCLRLLAVLAVFAPAPVHAEDTAEVRGRIVISPIRVALELSRSTVVAGSNVSAKAIVSNDGPTRERSIEVALRVDRIGLIVAKGSQTVKTLDPGSSRSVSWTLCGGQPGVYLVLAQATWDGVTVESPARLLTVLAGKKRC